MEGEVAVVLVADDSISMRKLIAALLQERGHEVLEADDGSTALTLAKSNHVDLVITDLIMPEMDGITLIRELRSIPEYGSVPVLVLTTERKADSMERSQRAGATGWLSKPFNAEQLIATVENVLESRP